METITADRWLTRQELADRHSLPVKTPALWTTKGIGPPYGKFGKHVRYPLSDVIDWERAVRQAKARLGMTPALRASSRVVVLCSTD
jgi:hypothetical protein